MDKQYCKCCGRSDRKLTKGLCPRHRNQEIEYGYFLDNNPRDEFDTNEIIEHEDYAEIVLYDNLFNELEEKIIIDLEDVSTVKGIIWKKQGKYINGFANQYSYELPNLILDTDERVYHIDGNIYNNRKSNLEVMKKKRFKHHFSSNKKHKNKILVTSLGGSTDGITGTSIAIEYTLDNGNKDLVLLECGSMQSNRIKEDYLDNKKMIDNIPFNLASAIFVAHVHNDHCGNLAAGSTRGFNGKIITTPENAELLKPMLLDSSFIHGRNVASLNNKGGKYKLLYDEGDTYTTLSKIESCEYNKIHKLNSNLSYRFTTNNHCVGSSQIELFIKKPSGRVVKIAFTSDIGSNYNQKYKPYSEDRTNISKANLLIIESTYADKDRCFTKKDVDKDYKDFMDKIREVTYRGNRVLVPVFSYDRSQSFMTLLYDEFKDDPKFKDIKVIVDSRLLNTINATYRNILKGDKLDKWNEVMSWKNFIFVDEFKRTEVLAAEKDNPCVILSSSGMMAGAGHVMTYAKSILPRRNDCLCFIGYCSPNVVGGKIQAGAKSVTIDDVNIPVKCEVNVYKCFSGHSQHDELVSYILGINSDIIAIHHGDTDCKNQLKFDLEESMFAHCQNKKIKILSKKENQIIL